MSLDSSDLLLGASSTEGDFSGVNDDSCASAVLVVSVLVPVGVVRVCFVLGGEISDVGIGVRKLMIFERTDWEVARVAADRFRLIVLESPLASPKMPQILAQTSKEN